MMAALRKRTTVWEWLVAMCCCALLIAPFGCQFQDLLNDLDGLIPDGQTGDLNTRSVGFFINSDAASPLLVAGRAPGGGEFFIFGTRDAQGNLAQVTAIDVVSADGASSFLLFENGWPVVAQGPDGSYVRITYAEQTETRVAATVEVRDAGRNRTDTFPVEIDLQRTAEQVARLIENATGQTVDVPKETDATGLLKSDQRSISVARGSLLFLAFVVPVIAVVQFSVVSLGQFLLQALDQSFRNIVTNLFEPLIVIADLVSGSLGRVEFTPLFEVFIEVPVPPRFSG